MRRTRMTGTRLLLTAAAMLGLLAVGACEGENLFSVPPGAGGSGTGDTKAPVVSIMIPRGDSLSAKPVGDSVFVTAHVTDNAGLRSIRMYGVARRGVDTLGTDTVVQRFAEKTITVAAGVKDTTVYRYLAPTPDSTKERAIIVVEATDTMGNLAADSVDLVLGGPDVQLLNVQDGLSITAGGQLSIGVLARDPQGITVLTLSVSGAYSSEVVWRPNPAQDSLVVDTVLAVPATALGPLTVRAVARNALDVAGQSVPVTLNVVAPGRGDTIPPSLRHTSSAPERMEIQDSVSLTVTAADNTQGSGVAAIGYSVLGISARGDTLVRSGEKTFAPPRTGTVVSSFGFGTFNVDSLNLPDTLVYELTTWVRDNDGNCAAAVGLETATSLPCSALATGETVAQGRTGQRIGRTVVAGKTVRLPAGGRILDAAVDTARRQLYLSNITNNRLEVFDLQAEAFKKAIGVGSEPWGLAFSRDNDSLWVANSGGTNLSVVDLDKGREVDNDRFLTPDVVLFEIEVKNSDAGIQLLIREYPQAATPSFSDRPQFVAVDSFGNLVYSTKTSLVGDLGTVRKGYFDTGWDRSEAKIFIEHGELDSQENFVSLAHIDSIQGTTDTVGVDTLTGAPLTEDNLAFFDHVPGFPDQIIKGLTIGAGIPAIDTALTQLRNQGSDVFSAFSAKWNISSLTFRDTTYVAASGDGGWISVGEGGAAPVGRVLSYGARPLESTALSRSLQVADLLTNPAEEVRGIGLNYDGTLGVVRGRFAAYFFSPSDLRLQGQVEIPTPDAGAGAALHPLHADFRTLENLGGSYQPDTHLAFVASGEHTVDVIDTQRYTRIGRVYIRDVINGPLRAVLPFPADNAGFQCSSIPVQDKRGNTIGTTIQIYESGDFLRPIAADGITEDRCVVMKLFATTTGGGVVVIDVRKADILKEHPERRQ